MRRATFLLVVFSITSLSVFFRSGPASAAEAFRIETKIYTGDPKDKKIEPISKTTTLFKDGIVYDFLENPEQTAVFRKATGGKPGRFILMNDKERAQTEVSTDKLANAMKDLRKWALNQKAPFLKFAANPRFDETFDRDTGKLVLTSPLETYTVDTSPASQHQDSMTDYHEFLDWYTQLNTLLTSPVPPDPRLKLNGALMRHRVVPTKVELKRTGEDLVWADHDFTWRLSQQDLQRIEDVQSGLTAYKQVENKEFLQMSQPVMQGK
jgi:hypothetical protein